MNPVSWLRKHLEEGDPDLLRSMLGAFAEQLMAAEASAICNAGYGEVTPGRVNSRNGYRTRDFDTRVGTIELAIPKLRTGSYFPDWLVEPRRRAERALVAVIAQCYVEGVSTRRVDDVVKAMGIDGISKSQVSELAKCLDAMVSAFRNRPLDGGPYSYIWLDALTQKVREGGRIVNVAVIVATGVNADGHREILGVDLITTEDGAGWTAFLRGLVARGLSGVARQDRVSRSATPDWGSDGCTVRAGSRIQTLLRRGRIRFEPAFGRRIHVSGNGGRDPGDGPSAKDQKTVVRGLFVPLSGHNSQQDAPDYKTTDAV